MEGKPLAFGILVAVSHFAQLVVQPWVDQHIELEL